MFTEAEGVYIYTNTQFRREVMATCNAVNVRLKGKGPVDCQLSKSENDREESARMRVCEKVRAYKADERWKRKGWRTYLSG
jgi:hypothetical protein